MPLSIAHAALPATAPAQPIMPAPDWIDPHTAVTSIVFLLAIAALVLAATKSFRRNSIVGRARLTDATARPIALWGVLGLGLIAWIGAQAMYLAARHLKPETLSPTDAAILSLAGPLVGLAALLIGDRLADRHTPRALGCSVARLPAGLFIGVIGAFALVPLVEASSIASQWAYQAIYYAHPDEHELLKQLGDATQPRVRWAIIFAATVAAPVFEELLFRGHLQTLLVAAMSRFICRPAAVRWLAVFVTAALFALLHDSWMRPMIFVLAITIGYAYERTGNLWAGIVMHAAFNTVGVAASLVANH